MSHLVTWKCRKINLDIFFPLKTDAVPRGPLAELYKDDMQPVRDSINKSSEEIYQDGSNQHAYEKVCEIIALN
jgi:hypothetical protein